MLAGVLALCFLPVVTAHSEPAFAEFAPWRGAAQPSFTLESIAGDRVDLAARADRVVLVHFFATWCTPCRAEMAALRRLADRFTARGLAILAVDVGEPESRVRHFFADDPVTFPVLLDRDNTVTRAWQVSTLPTTVVLDRALAPRVFAEGDVDWDHADTDRLLDAVAARIHR